MTNPMSLSPEAVGRLTVHTEPWLSCDDCFELVDTAIVAVLDSTARLPEAFRVHLLGCSVCHEEAQSLAALVAGDFDLSEAEAAARLDVAVLGADI